MVDAHGSNGLFGDPLRRRLLMMVVLWGVRVVSQAPMLGFTPNEQLLRNKYVAVKLVSSGDNGFARSLVECSTIQLIIVQ